MKQLQEFIKNHDVDFCENKVTKEQLDSMTQQLQLKLGKQLITYLLEYGYLGYEWIEFMGVNSVQLSHSDLFSDTLYLHKHFPKTTGYIVFESLGEGDYALVNKKDEVFNYFSETGTLSSANSTLFQYILKRFSEVEQ